MNHNIFNHGIFFNFNTEKAGAIWFGMLTNKVLQQPYILPNKSEILTQITRQQTKIRIPKKVQQILYRNIQQIQIQQFLLSFK